MKVPHWVAMAFAFFDENLTGRLLGKEPRATVEAVRMGKKKMFASSAKAERELGFRQAPVYPALRARGGMVSCAWLCKAKRGARIESAIAIVAAMAGELRPLVKGWKREDRRRRASPFTPPTRRCAAFAGLGLQRASWRRLQLCGLGPIRRNYLGGWAGAARGGWCQEASGG